MPDPLPLQTTELHWHERLLELKPDLAPELYRRVWTIVDDANAAATASAFDETAYLIDGLCAHFPGFAPAIRAVAVHLVQQHMATRESTAPIVDACDDSWEAAMDHFLPPRCD